MHICFAVLLNVVESFNNNNNNNVVKTFPSHSSLHSLELFPLLPRGRVTLGTIPTFPRVEITAMEPDQMLSS